jgi:hypothetical protein
MDKKMYEKERAALIRALYAIDRRFFPRCFRARLRYLARLDAIFSGNDVKEVYKEVCKQWNY